MLMAWNHDMSKEDVQTDLCVFFQIYSNMKACKQISTFNTYTCIELMETICTMHNLIFLVKINLIHLDSK